MQDRHVHLCIHERMRTVVVSTDKVTICSVSFTSWVSRDGQNPISVSKRAAKTLVHNSTSQKTSWDPVDGFPKANNNVMPRMTVSLQAEEEEEPASKVNQTSSAARRKREQASNPKERDRDRARERERGSDLKGEGHAEQEIHRIQIQPVHASGDAEDPRQARVHHHRWREREKVCPPCRSLFPSLLLLLLLLLLLPWLVC